MSGSDRREGLYSALLKHWRGKRGLSQLDLALAADVSTRHVSFLETGRSEPSAAMVLRLAAALDVPLRHVDAMLRAAGHEAIYADREEADGLPPDVRRALDLMKSHLEPMPVTVLDRGYDVIDANAGAMHLFSRLVDPSVLGNPPLNIARLAFDPRGAQPALVNFDAVGPALLWRLQREVLADPDDGVLRRLLDDVLAMPTVAEDWREPDLSVPASPAMVIHLRVDDEDLRFVTVVTAFQAPQSVTLDELKIETWFPHDAETAAVCRRWAGL